MSVTSRRISKNARLAIACLVVLAGMTGMAFAAVPLYHKFCEVTGFDGTTKRAKVAPGQDQVLDRTVTVRFDANVRDMPWTFAPSQTSQTVRIGAQNVAFYKVTNTSDQPITGQATFNVVPEVAGAHFVKLQCFCFTQQTIGPHQSVEFPVVYFVDPTFVTDPETKRMGEIVLSYTFFQVKDQPGRSAAAKSPSPGLGEPPRAGL
jgi:cytochrome c oxidase assembly protein subunit 11